MEATTFRTACAAMAIALALAAGGCGGDERSGAEGPARTEPGTIRAGDPVPVPDGPAVLRIRGVEGGNAGTSTALDLATIEELPRVEVQLYEPFQNREMTFRGVPMADLLRISGVQGPDASIYIHALDDYHVEFGLRELEDAGAVLATRADGRPIALKDGGPIRVVFPRAEGPGKNKDNWIWSVDWIRVSA